MKRVLLVEDDLDELEILYWMLIDQGCNVRTANTAKAAVSLGKQFRPTLLVTDLLLSRGATGVDVIRELRKLDPSLPALVITGMAPRDVQQALGELADADVMHKPFTERQLLDRLSGLTRAA